MTAQEYQRQAFRGFKESKDYKFVNLSFGLISAAGNIAYAISNAGKYHDLALSDEELNNALPRLGCSVLPEVVDHLSNVLWFTTVFARCLGFSLEDLMNKSIEHKRFEQILDERASTWGKDRK